MNVSSSNQDSYVAVLQKQHISRVFVTIAFNATTIVCGLCMRLLAHSIPICIAGGKEKERLLIQQALTDLFTFRSPLLESHDQTELKWSLGHIF